MAGLTKCGSTPVAAAAKDGPEAAEGRRLQRRARTLALWVPAVLFALALGCGETPSGSEGPDGALTRIDLPKADAIAGLPVLTAADTSGPEVGLAAPASEDATPEPGAYAGPAPKPALAGAWFEIESNPGTLVSARIAAARGALPPSAHRADPGEPGPGSAGTEPSGEPLEFLFDKESEAVNPAYFGTVERLARQLQEHPGATAVLEGHADSRGSAEYNQKLSLRRAEAVAKLLAERHGVEASRVRAVGLGEERPLAENDTMEGRAQNRRVVAVFVGR